MFRFNLIFRFFVCLFLLAQILLASVIWMSKRWNSNQSVYFEEIESISRKPHSTDEIQRIKEAKSCFQPNNSKVFENIQLFEDVLEAETRPQPGKAIFFHDTSCIQDGIAVLNSRQACAIESAAKWNPNRDVFVIFTSKVGLSQDLESFIIRALKSYPNIHFRNVNLTTYSSGTPMASWFQTDQLFLSSYLTVHICNFLRLTSLFKYGGIYLDLDVVVQQSFDSLPSNFVAAEDEESLGSAIIGFQADGVGHEIAELCTRVFTSNFNGQQWGANGPDVLTRVLMSVCAVNSTGKMTPERCRGFKVFPPQAFYAIPYPYWEMFFYPIATQWTLQLTENSIIVHFWNDLSSKRIIRKGEKTAYEIIANNNCPRVYHASADEF